MLRLALALVMSLMLSAPLFAQNSSASSETERAETGGAQTLEDILARQRGEPVNDTFRRSNTGNPDSAAGFMDQLGTLGGVSDPELWRALRFGSADVTVSSGGDVATVIMQDGGMRWLAFRRGPLSRYGAYLLGATLLLLALFYLLRGRVQLDSEPTGRTITRFQFIERFGHWVLAGSFILLAVTGLITLFGRKVLIPAFGRDAYASLAEVSKWVHNNVAWAFMLGLILVFVMWIAHNLPNRTDLTWLRAGGGIVGKSHPPAKKFNAGQKLIFWSVILMGSSIATSGLSLLFPFELPIFTKTFTVLNEIGVSGLLGFGELPTRMSPQEEMQYAQMWHAIVSFVLIAIILAHIYIGSIGMEGAFDAMGTGEVDEAWAEQHHSIWLDEVKEQASAAPKGATPAK